MRYLVAWLIAVVSAVVLFALLWSSLYQGAAQSHESVIYPQALWGLGHGAPQNSVYPIHSLAIHGHFVYYLLVPFTAIAPAAIVLMVAQAVTLAATLLVVFFALRRAIGELASPAWVALGGCFFFVIGSPLLMNPFLFDTRPDLFAVPLVAAGLLRAESKDGFDWKAAAIMLPAVFVRVEWSLVVAVALVLVPPGLNHKLSRFQRWALAVLCMAYFVAFWVWIRGWLGGGEAFARTENALTVLVFADEGGLTDGMTRLLLTKVEIVAIGLVTMGTLTIRGWRWLGSGALGFGLLLITTKHYEQTLNLHYAMFAAPALLTASVAGLRRWQGGKRKPGRTHVLAAIAVALVCYVFSSALPGGGRFRDEYFNLSALIPNSTGNSYSQGLQAAHQALRVIPGDAGAAVTYLFGAPLADRREIWSMIEVRRRLEADGVVPEAVDWVGILPQNWHSLGRVLVNQHDFRLVALVPDTLALLTRAEEPATPWDTILPITLDGCPSPIRCPDVGLSFCPPFVADDGSAHVVVERFAAPTDDFVRRSLAALLVPRDHPDQGLNLSLLNGLVNLSQLPLGARVAFQSEGELPDAPLQLMLIDRDGVQLRCH